MTFYLTDSPTADLADTSHTIWSEDYPTTSPVSITNGQFSVALGSVTPIPDGAFLKPALYLAIKVAGTELTGRQRVYSSPYAVTAAQAQDLVVNGNESVSGNATINGTTNLNVANISSAGIGNENVTNITATNGNFTSTLHADPPDNPNDGVIFKGIMLSRNHVGWVNTTTDHSEIDNDTGSYNELMIIGNKHRDGGTRRVGIWDFLEVNGGQTVSGGLNVTNGVLQVGHWTLIDREYGGSNGNSLDIQYNGSTRAWIHDDGTVHAASNAGLNTCNCSAVNIGTISDERLKKIHGPYAGGLDKILQLQPILYDYSWAPGDPHLGLGAQSVEPIIPEAVKNNSGTLSVEPMAFVATLINAVKEQQQTIASLNGRLDRQQAEIDELRAAIEHRR
jgi:hypothetical protein